MEGNLLHIKLKELTEKYLSNQASKQERQQLFDLISEDVSLRIDFHKIKRAYFEINDNKNSSLFDDEAAFDAFQKKISNSNGWRNKSIWLVTSSVAASILIIFAVWFVGQSTVEKRTIVSESNEKMKTVLSDGSIVTLNKNSTLSFLDEFSEDTREVLLQGEAFFNVTPNPLHPFVVKAGDVVVTVLGTSFNVDMNDSACVVTVKTGTVKVESVTKNFQCVISHGESAVVPYANDNYSFGRNVDQNYLAWETGMITFEDATPSEVARVINKYYGVQFEYNALMDSCLLNAKFNNDPLETVVKTIEITFGAKSKHEKNTVVFAGEGC